MFEQHTCAGIASYVHNLCMCNAACICWHAHLSMPVYDCAHHHISFSWYVSACSVCLLSSCSTRPKTPSPPTRPCNHAACMGHHASTMTHTFSVVPRATLARLLPAASLQILLLQSCLRALGALAPALAALTLVCAEHPHRVRPPALRLMVDVTRCSGAVLSGIARKYAINVPWKLLLSTCSKTSS